MILHQGPRSYSPGMTLKSNRRLAPAAPAPKVPIPADVRKQYSPGSRRPTTVTLKTPGRSFSCLNCAVAFWSVPEDDPHALNSPTTVSRLSALLSNRRRVNSLGEVVAAPARLRPADFSSK